MLMKSLVPKLGSAEARINAVPPCAIMTDIKRATWKTIKAHRDLSRKIPGPNVGELDDAAKALLWLDAHGINCVHGDTPDFDGGIVLNPNIREGG